MAALCLVASLACVMASFRPAFAGPSPTCTALCVITICWNTPSGCMQFSSAQGDPNLLYSTTGGGTPKMTSSSTADIMSSCDQGCKAPDSDHNSASANCSKSTGKTKTWATCIQCQGS